MCAMTQCLNNRFNTGRIQFLCLVNFESVWNDLVVE